MSRFVHHRPETEDARRHLEQSRADRPAVDKLVADLRREAAKNNFAARVDASLKGRS